MVSIGIWPSEPFGPGLDDKRLVTGDGRRAVDIIGEEARGPGVELLHAEASGVLVALVDAHVRRHVLQAFRCAKIRNTKTRSGILQN